MRKGKYDAPCKREERLLNTLVNLRRRLHKLDAQLIGKFPPLILSYRLLVHPVRLVTDQYLVYSFRRMLLNVSMPRPYV